jgi:hypothetical protein
MEDGRSATQNLKPTRLRERHEAGAPRSQRFLQQIDPCFQLANREPILSTTFGLCDALLTVRISFLAADIHGLIFFQQ